MIVHRIFAQYVSWQRRFRGSRSLNIVWLFAACLLSAQGAAYAQVDTCAIRCPAFAPIYNAKTFMCQEHGIEPLALENVLKIPTEIPKLIRYVFWQFKGQIDNAKKAQGGKPDCNHSASYFPEFKPEAFGKAVCNSQFGLWNDWLAGKPYKFVRKDIQFTIWCIGTYGAADFRTDAWKTKLEQSKALD